ncbi:hypothetical protein I4U23_024843 [Adineta vaga]|nr:hypothetical protein I4U23_024843 [Adineta vaga]
MASSTVHQQFICHFCFDPFPNRASMVSHFSQCLVKNSTKNSTETLRLPRLNKSDQDILQMLNLHRINVKRSPHTPQETSNPFLQIPLSNGSISYTKQSSFDDAICNLSISNDNQFEHEQSSNTISTKSSSSSSSYHIYKYSRREQKHFYASIKRARLKKQYSTVKKSSTSSFIFKHKNCLIRLPTQITSRQRLNTNSNNSYPLIFDPNFHSLVQISTNNRFENYLSTIKIYFHLIHSIASQEFQIIVNSNDQQHHVSYTAFSFLNLLRQTMTEYTRNLQKTLKRNYFQTFQHTDQQIFTPAKIRRIEPSSTSSSIRQEQPLQTTLSNSIFARNDPVQSDLTIIDYQQPIDRTNTEPLLESFMPITEERKTNRSPSPIFLKKQKMESIQTEELISNPSTVRIRVINEADVNKTQLTSRKKLSNSLNKHDENSPNKRPSRMSTRKSLIKTEVIAEIIPPYQSIPVQLSSTEITKQWSTHNVFYRCHACSHEEFFVVLSRECMNLHLSSKHGNMEENFKQRLATYLNKKGRSIKIFQHYLKWQQPWSDKEIDQIFKLSNK